MYFCKPLVSTDFRRITSECTLRRNGLEGSGRAKKLEKNTLVMQHKKGRGTSTAGGRERGRGQERKDKEKKERPQVIN